MSSKSRLTPIDRTSLKTIPRIELNATKVGVVLYQQLTRELTNISVTNGVYFWTDSTAVLMYLASFTCNFQAYVANRLAYILSSTTIEQWKKLPSKMNPADILGRGVSSIESFVNNDVWKEGPGFLKRNKEVWPKRTIILRYRQKIPSEEEDFISYNCFKCVQSHPYNPVISIELLQGVLPDCGTSSIEKPAYKAKLHQRTRDCGGIKNGRERDI